MSDTPQTPIQPRPKAVILFMTAPMVFALLLMVAAGTVALLGRMGTDATGARLTLRFSGACVAAARPFIQGRAAEIGLGEPQYAEGDDGLRLTATMPGLPDDATAMPALLARPGRFTVNHNSAVLAENADLRMVEIRLDESGMPYTWVQLGPEAVERLRAAIAADPQGKLVLRLDDEVVSERPNTAQMTDDSLRVVTGEGMTADRMRVAADRAIVLHNGPIPCALETATVPAG
jgi:hypothetical protein